MPGRWTKEADQRLWAKKDTPVPQLAVEFERSQGGIRSRLKHLRDPSQEAFRRLFGSHSMEIEQDIPSRESKTPGRWTKEADQQLWAKKDTPVPQLAMEFKRSKGGIRSRLNHLQDPYHEAYRRLFGSDFMEKAPGRWTKEADQRLWAKKDMPVQQLAMEFERSKGAIHSRLEHLRDPSHKAFQRLFGSDSMEIEHDIPSRENKISAEVLLLESSHCARQIKNQEHKEEPTEQRIVLLPLNLNREEIGKPEQRMVLSPLNSDQREAASYILSGGNVFLTGAAGVGKSHLLRHVIHSLRDKYEGGNTMENDRVVVAATTGIAASHINGVTIHSWSGVWLGKGGASVLVPRVTKNKVASRRWRRAKVLILDEVSMMDGIFFEALNAIAQEVRACPHLPFGGIQLVLSGDFFQLPPVSLKQGGFAFEAPAWKEASIKVVELKTVVRQSSDFDFMKTLNQIRVGICSPEISDALDACHIERKRKPIDGILPTKIYCTNRNVDRENDRKLAELPGDGVLFLAEDEFKGNLSYSEQKILAETLERKSPRLLNLKVGAQVILTRNVPDLKLVNGSRGTVESFEWASDTSDQDPICAKQQYPVVHFFNGVRLRVREMAVFQGGSSGTMLRRQLPLKLAWSLTVHKSQGMTIEQAELQLHDAFDYGQVYVALSRVISLDGLWIRGGRITQSIVKANPKVKEFYRRQEL